MRKKCIAIAKKAMVWALAASMLVATPLTASAAGLRGVYSTTDGSGNDVKGPDGETTGDPSRTGTVTTTNTNTGALVDGEGKITGISINPSDVQLELDGEPARGKNQEAVTATILGNVPEEELEKLQNKLTWRVKDTSIATVDAKAADRTTANLTPWKGGDTVVEVTLDDYERNIHFKAEAAVHVKEYTQDFSLAIPADARLYVNHTLDLNDLISERNPGSANDTFTFGIDCPRNVATVNAANVVTFKRTGNVDVTAVSEKGHVRRLPLTVTEGVKSTRVTLHKVVDGVEQSDVYKTETLEIANNPSVNVVAVLEPNEGDAKSTDTVTWTSNKPDVVGVGSVSHDWDNARSFAGLELKKVGKATITARASSGKSAKVAITVRATLTGLAIADINVCEEPNTAYTGQIVQMEALRTPAVNTDSLRWTVDNRQIASINSKGVLTVKPNARIPDGQDSVTINITVDNKRGVSSETKPITIKQNRLTGFSVYEGSNGDRGTLLIKVGTDGKQTREGKGKRSTLNVPQNKTYTATVNEGGLAGTLNWVSSNTKVATVEKDNNGKAVITPLKKGTSKITVSGVMEIPGRNNTSSLKLVKATFTADVRQSATTLTMNKTSQTVKYSSTNAARKNLTASFSVKQNANPKEAITWSSVQTVGEGAVVTNNGRNGKFTLTRGTYDPGDVIEVTARAASGITAKATIYVVEETNRVVIAQSLNEGTPVEYDRRTTTLGLGNTCALMSLVETKSNRNHWIEAGEENTAPVTYTANKKDTVQIVGNKVTRLKSGKVTITARTSDGKSYKLTLN